jgi:sulfite reductase alpha subunit-like flavoprotein
MATLLALEFGSDATGPIVLNDLSDLLVERFEKQQQRRILVVVVTATCGTGDPPATAKNFTSRAATVPDCSVDSSIDYAVLALDNSAYRQSFAAFGYQVDMLLNAAGCSSVMQMQVVDECRRLLR